MENSTASKRISVFKDGVKVAVYPSIGQTAKAIGIGHTTIAKIANGARGAYRGLSFQFAQADEKIFMPTTPIALVDQRPPRKGRGFPVVAFKDGQLVGRYNSLADAGKALSVNSGGISAVLAGKQKLAGGYVFAYDLESPCQRKPRPLPLDPVAVPAEGAEGKAKKQPQEQASDTPQEAAAKAAPVFLNETHKEKHWGAEQAFHYLQHEADWEKELLTDALNWYDRTVMTLAKINPDKVDIIRLDDRIDYLYTKAGEQEDLPYRIYTLEEECRKLKETVATLLGAFGKAAEIMSK